MATTTSLTLSKKNWLAESRKQGRIAYAFIVSVSQVCFLIAALIAAPVVGPAAWLFFVLAALEIGLLW